MSSQLSKRRLTERAKADVEESIDAIADYKKQIAELEKHREEAISVINAKWGDVVNDINEVGKIVSRYYIDPKSVMEKVSK